MQTFVPFPSLKLSAAVLDYRRLGKQRVETFQLLRANLDITLGWKNHPAAKMWLGHEAGLIAYGVAICDEWIARGFKDTCREKILAFGEPDASDMPAWWGMNAVHSSHRSALLRKNPEWYGQFEWADDPSVPYVWPTGLISQ
jgi:hypothetical protein